MAIASLGGTDSPAWTQAMALTERAHIECWEAIFERVRQTRHHVQPRRAASERVRAWLASARTCESRVV